MDKAARSVLFFAIIGVLAASSVIGVFQSAPVIAKNGTVSIYFTSMPPDIQSDMIIPGDLATAGAQGSVQILSLNVTIDSVSVHRSGAIEESGWTVISTTPVTIDVMKPTNVTMLIAMGQIPEQNITTVRLHVADATAAVKNSQVTVDVTVPSNKLQISLVSSIRLKGESNTSIFADRPHIVVHRDGTIMLTPILHLDRVEVSR